MNINISKVMIVVTVPIANADEIRKVLGDSGAGIIGNYSYCSISENIIGRFKGNKNTNPYIGLKNQLESVVEDKIEVQCNINILKEVLRKLRIVHPYEEPAIDIIPLINENEL